MLECRNCPYVSDEFNNRLKHHQKVLTDFEREYPGLKFPDPWYHQPKTKILNAIERACYCQKYEMSIGHLKAYGNPCEEAFQELIQQKSHDKQKRRNKRERDLIYKNHVKYLAKTYPSYPPPAMPVDENGHWNFDDPIGTVYYRRTYRGNHKGNRYSFYKKYSNRCVRRYKGEIHSKGNQHRKLFDYWWTVD